MRESDVKKLSKLNTYLLVTTLLPAIGCMSKDEWAKDFRMVAARSEYAWAVPGERRFTTMFFPWFLMFERDEFRVVRSDGRKWIGALASQSNDNQPHDVYFYMIDAQGRLRFVVPSISSGSYCVGAEYFVLLGDLTASKQMFEIRSVSNGRLVHKGCVSEYLRDAALSVAIAGNIVRLAGAEGEPQAFCEAPSARPLTADVVSASIHDLTEKGLVDKHNPWESRVTSISPRPRPAERTLTTRDAAALDQLYSHWEDDPYYPKQAQCGDVIISIPMENRAWLVAINAEPSGSPR
jgi:hypothetical protein